MSDIGDVIAKGVSLACAMDHHDECTRDGCTCFCHIPGGVREPRRPMPDPPRPARAAVIPRDEEMAGV